MDTNSTIELKLPQSGGTVVMKKFLTIGQSRELQRIMLAGSSVNTESGKEASLQNIPADTIFAMQDRAAELLVIEIRTPEGNNPYEKAWLDNLPVSDGNLVYGKINDITAEANLSSEDKKK